MCKVPLERRERKYSAKASETPRKRYFKKIKLDLTKIDFCGIIYLNLCIYDAVKLNKGVKMHPLIGTCPVCGGELTVTRLHCRDCDTTLEGHFAPGRFSRLTAEQLDFVETFIRCEGKLTRVQDEIGVSYPTARARLMEVIRALGYEVAEAAGVTPEQRKEILADLAEGKITSKEAIELLQGSD
jgi:hypothetical protein